MSTESNLVITKENLEEFDEAGHAFIHYISSQPNLMTDGTFETLKKYHRQCNLNLDLASASGHTPLDILVHNNQREALIELINMGANPDLTSASGFSPLMTASKKGLLAIVKVLAPLCRNIDLATNNYTALALAAENDHAEIIDELVKHGASVTPAKPAVHSIGVACDKGAVRALAALIRHGANVNVQMKGPWDTPLYAASRTGHVAAVKMLLANGAKPSVDSLSTHDKIALFSLMNDVDGLSGVLAKIPEEELIRQVNIISISGRTPLFIAAQNGFENIVRILLKCGASPDIMIQYDFEIKKPIFKDGKERNALMVAKENGHHAVVNAIHEHLLPARFKPQRQRITLLEQRMDELADRPYISKSIAQKFNQNPQVVDLILEKGKKDQLIAGKMKHIRANPNLKAYYQQFTSVLTCLLLSARSVQGGYAAQNGKRTKLQKGSALLESLGRHIPVAGTAIELLGAALALPDTLADSRNIKKLANIGLNTSQADLFIEKIVLHLTTQQERALCALKPPKRGFFTTKREDKRLAKVVVKKIEADVATFLQFAFSLDLSTAQSTDDIDLNALFSVFGVASIPRQDNDEIIMPRTSSALRLVATPTKSERGFSPSQSAGSPSSVREERPRRLSNVEAENAALKARLERLEQMMSGQATAAADSRFSSPAQLFAQRPAAANIAATICGTSPKHP